MKKNIYYFILYDFMFYIVNKIVKKMSIHLAVQSNTGTKIANLDFEQEAPNGPFSASPIF